MNKNQAEAEHDRGDQEFPIRAETGFDGTSHQALGQLGELDDVVHQVDGQGVHADPNERLRPLSPIPNFDDLVERGEEETTPASHHQNVGRGPKLLDHGKLQALQTPDEQT